MDIKGQVVEVQSFESSPPDTLVKVTVSRHTDDYGGTHRSPIFRIVRTYASGMQKTKIQSDDFNPVKELKGSYCIDHTQRGKNWGDICVVYHNLSHKEVRDIFYKEMDEAIRAGKSAADEKKLATLSDVNKDHKRLMEQQTHTWGDINYLTKTSTRFTGNLEPSEGYIEHTEETEREATENFIEYCEYAQKLQTELSEGSMFIQDELDYIALELAGIEEDRIDLSAREGDLERQMAFLKTTQSLINKRKHELNKEHEQVAAKRDSSEPETTRGVEMDEKQGNNGDQG